MIRLARQQVLLLHDQFIAEKKGSETKEGWIPHCTHRARPSAGRMYIQRYSKKPPGSASVLSKIIHS